MKRLLALLTALALLLALTVLPGAAETEADMTVPYGKSELALTLIDGFDETKPLPGFMDWGTGKMENGEIYMECSGSGLYDHYSMSTAALAANPTLGGHTHTVFAAANTSDGAIRFTFQPDVENDVGSEHAYVGAALAETTPIKLLWKDGTVENARFGAQSAGRDVFVLPNEFEGYIIIPHAVIATDISGQTPIAADGKLTYTGFGLHAVPEDSTYLELTITAVYACSELPAYEAPEKVTEVPTQKPIETPTEAPTVATEAPTEAPTETPTETPTDDRSETTEAREPAETTVLETESTASEERGCASALGASAALLSVAIAAVALKRKA